MFTLDRYRDELLRLHDHICPRQILGLRIGELAGRLLGVSLPQRGKNKRLLALVETDGCFADGVMVATGCSLGHRTLRLIDQGKVAVTFVDTAGDLSVGLRIWPRPTIRTLAQKLSPDAHSRWHAQLEVYQRLPDDVLLACAEVELLISVRQLLSRPHVRVTCQQCGEEVINEREVKAEGQVLCLHCAGEAYYTKRHAGPVADLPATVIAQAERHR